MLGVTVLSFVGTYAFLRYLKSKERVRRATSPLGPLLSKKWVFIIFILLILPSSRSTASLPRRSLPT